MKKLLTPLLIVIAALIGGTGVCRADDEARPVVSSYTLGVGSASLTDTYLTPLHYRGTTWQADYRRLQAAPFHPEKLTMKLGVNLDVAQTHNPAGNATMWEAMLTADWGVMRRWSLLPTLTLAIGGEVRLQGGAFYNARNGNNPASAKAAATIGLTGLASYTFRIGRLPIRAVYQPSLPALGAFFSPEYGQLYYEIYLGERRGLAHCAWWGNYFALDHLLAFDLQLGRTQLRLGYQGRYLSTHVNRLSSTASANLFVIGITTEWLSLSPRKPSPIPLIHAY
ncbi:MAG: DUF3316 domain-containing protein [Duncaniella sp.]|nr:DUF3316 domain-containing protein [Duncaniella sp.]